MQKAADGSASFDVSYRLGAEEQTQFNTTSLTVTLLRRLKRFAEKAQGREASKCILALPAHFNENQVNAVVGAAHAAGLKPIATVSTVVAGEIRLVVGVVLFLFLLTTCNRCSLLLKLASACRGKCTTQVPLC